MGIGSDGHQFADLLYYIYDTSLIADPGGSCGLFLVIIFSGYPAYFISGGKTYFCFSGQFSQDQSDG